MSDDEGKEEKAGREGEAACFSSLTCSWDLEMVGTVSYPDAQACRLHACAVDVEGTAAVAGEETQVRRPSSHPSRPPEARSPLTTHHHPSSCLPLLAFSASILRTKRASCPSHSSSPPQHASYPFQKKGHVGGGWSSVDGREAGGEKKEGKEGSLSCHCTHGILHHPSTHTHHSTGFVYVHGLLLSHEEKWWQVSPCFRRAGWACFSLCLPSHPMLACHTIREMRRA